MDVSASKSGQNVAFEGNEINRIVTQLVRKSHLERKSKRSK